MVFGDLRERFGSCFVTETPDGQLIPWKPLSIGEWLEYKDLLVGSLVPNAVIEDEIFRRCVVDPVLVKNISKLKAGTVSFVVRSILDYSGPSSPEEFNYVLDLNRNSISSNPMHEMVSWICIAFPAYTPDDIYALDYNVFMERLAHAETNLFRMGILSDPIRLVPAPDSEGSVPVPPTPPPSPAKPKIDPAKLKEAWDEINTRTQQPSQTVITEADTLEHNEIYTGDEVADRHVIAHKMVKETLPVYSEYIEQLRKDGKITIKPHEQRVAEAKQRAKENMQRFNKKRQSESKDDKEK